MSWLSQFFRGVSDPVSRILHVPDTDLFTVSDAAGVTPEQWRAVENEQVKYFEGRVVKQALPKKL